MCPRIEYFFQLLVHYIIFCNSSGTLFEPPAAAGEERKRGHPAPRNGAAAPLNPAEKIVKLTPKGDTRAPDGVCVPLHPLLKSYHLFDPIWFVVVCRPLGGGKFNVHGQAYS